MLLKWHKQGSAVIPTLEFWLINRPTLQGNLLDRYWTISNRVFEEGAAPETFVLRNQDEVDWNIWNATLLRHRESSGLSCRLSLVAAAGASAVFPGRLCWPVTCCVLPELPRAAPQWEREAVREDQVMLSRQNFFSTLYPQVSPRAFIMWCDVLLKTTKALEWLGGFLVWRVCAASTVSFPSPPLAIPPKQKDWCQGYCRSVLHRMWEAGESWKFEIRKKIDFLATSWNSNIGCMYFSDTKQLLQVKAFGCCFHIDMKTVENIGAWFHSGECCSKENGKPTFIWPSSGWLWQQRYMSSWDIFLSIVAPLVDLFLWDFPKMWQSLGRIVAEIMFVMSYKVPHVMNSSLFPITPTTLVW